MSELEVSYLLHLARAARHSTDTLVPMSSRPRLSKSEADGPQHLTDKTPPKKVDLQMWCPSFHGSKAFSLVDQLLLSPDIWNMVLLQLSAQSFLSTDEARTHARVIVQTGLIDPDRPSYDMNVLYPHHIWEVRRSVL
jgi:hypothetical protein